MNIKKHIIALDLSLTQTGYAICDNNFLVKKIGSIKTSSKNKIDFRLNKIWEELNSLKEKYPPDLIIIERGFTRYNIATQQLYRVHGIANLAFKNIEQIYYAPTTIKYALTGSGKSKKSVVQERIKEIYPNIKFKNEDESDAFALLVYYVHYKKEGAGDRCLYS